MRRATPASVSARTPAAAVAGGSWSAACTAAQPGRAAAPAPAGARRALPLPAAPSLAIVGGHDAAPGAYPSIAEITFGSSFLCTGTLIAPNYVLTAGHCGSITGAAVGTPAGWPAPLI